MPDVCLSFVLLFTILIIVVAQKLVLQQSKNVTAKCTETQSLPPSIQFSLYGTKQILVQQMTTQYLYTPNTAVFLHHKDQLSIVSDKSINNSDNFRIKCLSYSKINAILFFILCFSNFLFNLENLSTNVRKFRFPCYI